LKEIEVEPQAGELVMDCMAGVVLSKIVAEDAEKSMV